MVSMDPDHQSELQPTDASGTPQTGPRPLVVGLTGGTGVGKTTVAEFLAAKGAIIVDCDDLGRQVVAPGGGALAGIFERFGPDVRSVDGTLDRAALAAVVFNDPDSLDALNQITHPAIDVLIEAAIAEAPADAVVILDMAVLVESDLGAGQYHRVVVVEADLDVRIERLGARGMAPDDARSRIASQASDAERRAVADHVIRNDGSREQLSAQVDHVWSHLDHEP